MRYPISNQVTEVFSLKNNLKFRSLPEKDTNPRIDICPANPIIRNWIESTVGELVEDLSESDDFIHPNEGQLP